MRKGEKKREKERKRYLKKVKEQELCQIGPLTSAALFHKLSDCAVLPLSQMALYVSGPYCDENHCPLTRRR